MKMRTIVLADDDADDRMLLKEAFEENNIQSILQFVEDGTELMDFLYHKGKFIAQKYRTPSLILLDLNMPKLDGREALRLIKSDPSLKRIPVVVLSTSSADEDITETYDLGVNSFITKPAHFKDLLIVTNQIGTYWCDTVALPNNH